MTLQTGVNNNPMDATAVQMPPRHAASLLGRLMSGRTIMVVVAAAALLVVFVLLAIIAQVAFQERALDGSTSYTLQNFVELYTDEFAYETLANTAGFALVATVVALAFATPIAWLTERTDLPGSRWVFPLLTITLLVPSFFTAMGWQLLFHGRVGLVNQWLVQILPFDHSPLNINSVLGMGWVEGLSLIALAFVMVVGSVRSMDPALEESAQVHGLPLWRRLWRITLPLIWPGILGHYHRHRCFRRASDHWNVQPNFHLQHLCLQHGHAGGWYPELRQHRCS
jgi:iron(III) transport system permease protein